MEFTKLATSSTKDGILRLLNAFCCSTSCRIDFETGECFNAKGLMENRKVVLTKGRYIFGATD